MVCLGGSRESAKVAMLLKALAEERIVFDQQKAAHARQRASVEATLLEERTALLQQKTAFDEQKSAHVRQRASVDAAHLEAELKLKAQLAALKSDEAKLESTRTQIETSMRDLQLRTRQLAEVLLLLAFDFDAVIYFH
jgi:hypothetical protein